jgi:hypothetical protein
MLTLLSDKNYFRNNTHNTASKGPNMPIKIPPNLKSFISKRPVLNKIALGVLIPGEISQHRKLTLKKWLRAFHNPEA